jgi:hypothetical protein
MNYKDLRKGLAIVSIILGGAAVGIPDLVWSKFLIGVATSLNAASLYLLKEESEYVEAETVSEEEGE